MTTSTDGQLCYGILFEEDFEFPWSVKKWDDGINDWWRFVNGYKPPFKLYDESGEYTNGVEPPRGKIDEYWKHEQEWDDEHPLPVDLINVCSHNYPQYILAHPDSIKIARRGYPEEIEARDMLHVDDWFQVLCGFCDKYGIDRGDEEPKWWLSSYWG